MKVLATALMLLSAVFSFEAQAQCTFTTIQEELCNSDGEIEINFDDNFTAPYTIDTVSYTHLRAHET